jgi:hypothetical protein
MTKVLNPRGERIGFAIFGYDEEWKTIGQSRVFAVVKEMQKDYPNFPTKREADLLNRLKKRFE